MNKEKLNGVEDLNLWYLLDENNEPYPVSIEEWSKGYKGRKIVKQENIGELFISTVFLGIEHSFTDSKKPVLFETMVFGWYKGYTSEDRFQQRYCTYKEALEGHNQVVLKINNNEDL